MKSVLDPSFKYTPAAATDIRRRFDAIRREQARVQRICEECEPWFDGSVFRPGAVVSVMIPRRVLHPWGY